jgi:hypothetical protein
MLRKMYLVTSDYLKEKPAAPQTKPAMHDKKRSVLGDKNKHSNRTISG